MGGIRVELLKRRAGRALKKQEGERGIDEKEGGVIYKEKRRVSQKEMEVRGGRGGEVFCILDERVSLSSPEGAFVFEQVFGWPPGGPNRAAPAEVTRKRTRLSGKIRRLKREEN